MGPFVVQGGPANEVERLYPVVMVVAIIAILLLLFSCWRAERRRAACQNNLSNSLVFKMYAGNRAPPGIPISGVLPRHRVRLRRCAPESPRYTPNI